MSSNSGNNRPPNSGAMSLEEFAEAHSISRSLLYTLINTDQAPVIMKVAGRRLISCEAAADWRRRMEGVPPTPDNDNDGDN